MVSPLSDLRSLLIDLDGVVYLGNTLLPGAAEFFAFLRRAGFAFGLVTNNSTATPAQYVVKLKGFGIAVDEAQVFTSGDAVADYLRRIEPSGAGVYIIGEDGLTEPVLRAGFWMDRVAPRYVLVGLDRNLSYEKLAEACLAIRNGAGLVASNPDVTQPTERGLMPGCGSLVAALRACSGVKPVIVGKPSPDMVLLAMSRLGVAREQTALLGDRLDTDVLAGIRAGVTTILVLTGATTRRELRRSRIQPDFVFEDLVALRLALEEAGREQMKKMQSL